MIASLPGSTVLHETLSLQRLVPKQDADTSPSPEQKVIHRNHMIVAPVSARVYRLILRASLARVPVSARFRLRTFAFKEQRIYTEFGNSGTRRINQFMHEQIS